MITAPFGAIAITLSSTKLLEAEDGNTVVQHISEVNLEIDSFHEDDEDDDFSVIRNDKQVLSYKNFSDAYAPSGERMKMIDETSDIFPPPK